MAEMRRRTPLGDDIDSLPVWAVVAVAALAIAVYSNSLHGELFYDDEYAIVRNRDVTAPESVPWAHLLKTDYWGMPIADERSHKSYRPLVVATFRLNHAVHGLDPWGYHAVNVALHAVASALALVAARVVCRGALAPAFVAAALFATHPVHTEAVSGVVGRAELMCFVFYLLAFLAAASAARPYSARALPMALAAAASVAATLSKETGVTVFGVIFFHDVLYVMNWLDEPLSEQDEAAEAAAGWQWAVARARAPFLPLEPRRLWAALVRQLGYAAFALAFMSWRVSLNGDVLPSWPEKDNPAAASDSLWLKALNYPYIYTLNGWLMLVPSALCADYSFLSVPPIESAADPRNALTALALALVLGAFVLALARGARTHLPVVLAAAFVAVPFLPSSNLFFVVGFLIAERVLYIPSFGVCVAVGYTAEELVAAARARGSPRGAMLVRALVIALVLGYSARTLARNRDWASEEALWASALPVVPHNSKVTFNLGNVYFARGDYARALELFAASDAVLSDDPTTIINMATTLAKLERYDDALRMYERASKLATNLGQYYNWGAILEHRGQYEDAIRVFHMASEISPSGGRLNLYQDDFPTKALAATHEGTLLCRLGRPDEGLARFLHAVRLDPGQWEAWMRIGLEYSAREMYQAAVAPLERALALNPGQPHSLAELERVRASLRAGDARARTPTPAPLRADASAGTGADASADIRSQRKGPKRTPPSPSVSADSVDELSRALAANPGDAALMSRLSGALGAAGDLTGALVSAERAVAAAPRSTAAHVALGRARTAVGDHVGAERALRVAASAPDGQPHADGRLLLGQVLARLDRHADALVAFDASIADGSGGTRVHLERGLSLAALGELDLAARALRRAIELEPRAEVYGALSSVLERMGRVEGAAKAARRAAAAEPMNPRWGGEAARLLLAAGLVDEAARLAAGVLEIAPEHGPALAVARAAAERGGSSRPESRA